MVALRVFPRTAKVIRRRDLGLESHRKDWRLWEQPHSMLWMKVSNITLFSFHKLVLFTAVEIAVHRIGVFT